MVHYVYLYYDPVRCEPIYVGMGQKKRAWWHLKRKDMHPFVQRLQMMERLGTAPEITFLVVNIDEELADLVEIEAIAKYGRKDLGQGPLLNLTDGGDGLKNVTEATRRKIGEASRGRKHSPETRVAISAFLRTRERNPLSAESKDKIRQKALGRKLSVEHKAKIGAGMSASIRPPCSTETRAKIGLCNRGRIKSQEEIANFCASRSKPCTVNGVEIYPSRKALMAALGQNANGTKHPNFRYV